MPRYFFDLVDGREGPDLEGTELPSLDAARLEAARRAGRLLRERAEDFWTGKAWEMHVRDDHGLFLFSLDIRAVEAPQAARKPFGLVASSSSRV